MAAIQSSQDVLNLLTSPENMEFERLLNIAEQAYDAGLMEEIMNMDNESLRSLQQLIQVTDFYANPEDSPLTRYVRDNYSDFPTVFNFEDSTSDPSIGNSMVSSLLSTVFRVKYNQILKTLFEGYENIVNITGDDMYSNIDDIHLIDSVNPFQTFLSEYVNGNTLHDLLMRLNRVYQNSSTDVMLVRYMSASSTSSQIAKEQIQDLVSEVRSINEQLYTQNLKIGRVMLISFDRLSSHASTMISNLSYYTMSAQDEVIEYRIKYELFYHNEMMYNILKSTLVPVHERLSDSEIQELFRKTGWNRNTLQSISYQDPVVLYHGFKVDDVIRIYRTSHANTELSRYSVGYRVVTPTPLFVNMDDGKTNRFIDTMT